MATTIMNRAQIERDVREFLINNFLFGRAEALPENGSLQGDVIDSTGAIELVMFLQSNFGITVEDQEVAVPENFGTVNNVVGYVEKKLLSKT
jgi:acyl carrier protein